MPHYFYLSVNVPEEHADKLREVLGDAGAGKIGKYTHSSFSIKGIGRFKPEKGADPDIGEVGEYTCTVEEKIETLCKEDQLPEIIAVIKAVHPYEEPAIIIYPVQLAD